MSATLNSLILDNDVIVELHELNFWNAVVKQNKLHVSRIVSEEAKYYYINGIKKSKNKKPILLDKLIEKKQIRVLSGCILEQRNILRCLKKFDISEKPELDAGELESLAIINKSKDLRFCTFDKAAIKALALMHKVDKGISFEGVLRKSGINQSKIFSGKYSQKYFDHWITQGNLTLVSS